MLYWGKLADIENPGNPNNPGIIYRTPITYGHKLESQTKTKGRKETTSFRSDDRGVIGEIRESQQSRGEREHHQSRMQAERISRKRGKNQMCPNAEMGQK